MLLISHILIASLSVLLSGYTFFSPSWSKLHVSYALIALTIISGTILILQTMTHMTQTCMTGLTYVGVVSIASIFTRIKLQKQSAE